MIHSKPIIGLLASHDSPKCNKDLVNVLDFLVENHSDFIRKFQFVVTRGTFRRVLMSENFPGVREDTRNFLFDCGVLRLPCRSHGGVVMMADLVVKRKVEIVWPFLTPVTSHWLSSENLALLRLCDQCRANRLMNDVSVIEWARRSLNLDQQANGEPWPPRFGVGGLKPVEDYKVPVKKGERDDSEFSINWEAVKRERRDISTSTLALIAHNEMKTRIEEFVLDYQTELQKFDRIITTGTTGKIVQEAAPLLAQKVRRYNSGPKGGDIEIAIEMIFKRCDVAVFLVDPLSAHPHSEDIRVLFGAAILNGVRLLTNERQARSWMDRTSGKVDDCAEYLAWLDDRRK
ncbi:MAG TPA: methylglyoxal synthase [Pyrinomonadaceae bacterium]|nr:methylglyoxal synthase [Pyrinomonadaceae bacterium]